MKQQEQKFDSLVCIHEASNVHDSKISNKIVWNLQFNYILEDLIFLFASKTHKSVENFIKFPRLLTINVAQDLTVSVHNLLLGTV